MTVLEKITNLLETAQIKYKKLQHQAVFTSEQASQIRGSSLDKGAKAIVCFADSAPILIVVPGDTKIDFKKFKPLFNVKDLRMASPDEVNSFTGLTIGSIPPVGKALGESGIKSFYDQSIKSKDEVVFNAGSHEVSIFLSPADLISIENPSIGDFAVPKN